MPAIYTTTPSLVEKVVRELCLPSSCVRVVPVNRSFGQSHLMESTLLEQLIQQDSESEEVFEPTLVITFARTDGHVDDTQLIKKVCDKYNVWLHTHGDAALLLLGKKEEKKGKEIENLRSFPDSFSFHPERAFSGMVEEQEEAILATVFNNNPLRLPSPLKRKGEEEEEEREEGEKEERKASDWWERKEKSTPFTLWFLLQSFGSEALQNTISSASLFASSLSQRLSKLESVELNSTPNNNSLKVVFRFASKEGQVQVETLNHFNQHLFSLLHSFAQPLGLSLQKVDQFLALCVEPLSSSNPHLLFSNSSSLLDHFFSSLHHSLSFFTHTLSLRSLFYQKVNSSKTLFPVQPSSDFVGLGAVRYLPPYLKHHSRIAPSIDSQLDLLNSSLAKRLKEQEEETFEEGLTQTQTLDSLSSSAPQPEKQREKEKEKQRRSRVCVLVYCNKLVEEKEMEELTFW